MQAVTLHVHVHVNLPGVTTAVHGSCLYSREFQNSRLTDVYDTHSPYLMMKGGFEINIEMVDLACYQKVFNVPFMIPKVRQPSSKTNRNILLKNSAWDIWIV